MCGGTYLGLAWAASVLAVLLLVAERIHYFEERRHAVIARTRSSLSDGSSSVASRGTLAALRGGGAVWLLALKLALGLGAGGGLLALPVALGLLAHGVALGLRSDALGVALGRGADGLPRQQLQRRCDPLSWQRRQPAKRLAW